MPEQPEFSADCVLYLRRSPDELIDITAVRDAQGEATLTLAHGIKGQPDTIIEFTKREAQQLIMHLNSPIVLEIFDMEF